MNVIVVEDGSGKGQCDAHGRAPGHTRHTVPLEVTQRTYKVLVKSIDFHPTPTT